MPLPETPKPIRRSFDRVIDRLNGRWDLQLPRLHGRVADSAENEEELPRRITSRIRFLCFRPHLNLERLLDDFEKYSNRVRSDWVFKPNQEVGTLPNLPNDKSRLFEESLAKPLRLTSAQRKELLCYIDKLLADEYRLSHDSAAYQRSFGGEPGKGSETVSTRRGRNSAEPATTGASTPAISAVRDTIDHGMAKKSATAVVQNGRKRSPSRDAVEVYIHPILVADPADECRQRSQSLPLNGDPQSRDRRQLQTPSE